MATLDSAPKRVRAVKPDAQGAAAVELARAAAVETAGVIGVGEHMACVGSADRVVTHTFACPHPGYRGWQWSVTLVRASRAKEVTVNEVVLLPGEDALQAPAWVPYADRITGGDVEPGMLMPTPDNDPRLVPGYTTSPDDATSDPDEFVQMRAVVQELGLGRERLLSPWGKDQAAQRWLESDGGPDNQMTKQAPGACVSCGYFVRLQGSLGQAFGVCANEYSPSDGSVVAMDHGCGAHSDVTEEKRGVELREPVWDTISFDEGDSLFD